MATPELTAGRDTDVLVAGRVFGCRVTTEYPATIAKIPVCGCDDPNRHHWLAGAVPAFSTSTDRAFLVVDRMIADGWRIYIDGPRFGDSEWRVMFAKDRLNEWARAEGAGGLGYGDLKKGLFEHYWNFFAPYRARRAELAADPAYVESVLKDGAARARAIAAPVLARVRQASGLA